LLNAYDNRPTLRTRLVALVLSSVVIALLIATLIAMGMLKDVPGGSGERLTSVRLVSFSPQSRPKARDRSAPAKSQAVVQSPHPMPSPTPKIPPLKLIQLSRAEFAAADISKLSRHADDASGSSGASGSGAAYGPGEGPGGAHLYNAEWYREPTHAELAGYLKSGAPRGSWAMIACKTIDHFHVEDCRELGESPPGSGLSRALRQAAWQFLVRPPRIDGKPMIGAWVRIRFDFIRPPEPDAGE
jgi:protein TonB